MRARSWRVGALCLTAVWGAVACSRGVRVESAASASVVTPADSRALPPGVEIELALDEPIGTRSSHVEDEFNATVQHAVLTQDGQVAVPAGAKVVGHVSALHRGGVGRPPVIRLEFDRLAFGGRSYAFEARIARTDAPAARGSHATLSAGTRMFVRTTQSVALR